MDDLAECLLRHGQLNRGLRGRVVFQAYLAIIEREKGSKLTVQDLSQACATEAQYAFTLGKIKLE